MNHVVVTGIGTGVGKTVCSAVICEALGAHYWKPLQSGDLHQLDSGFVDQLTSDRTHIYSENLLLTQPLSPHAAARIDGIEITDEHLEFPDFTKQTVIEGAGGVYVPLNDVGLTYIDLFQLWDFPVYVITRHYLGSINHTLLTVNALLSREITIAGLIVNGTRNEATERVYKQHFSAIPISYIPEITEFTKESIQEAAKQWKETLR